MRGIHKDGKGIQASRPDALSHIAELLPAHALRLGGSGDDAREICEQPTRPMLDYRRLTDKPRRFAGVR